MKLVCVIYLCALFRQVCHSTTLLLVGCVSILCSRHLLKRTYKCIVGACCVVGRIFNCLCTPFFFNHIVLHCYMLYLGLWFVLMLIICFNIFIYICFYIYVIGWHCGLVPCLIVPTRAVPIRGPIPRGFWWEFLVTLCLLSVSISTPLTPSGPKGTREGSLMRPNSSLMEQWIVIIVFTGHQKIYTFMLTRLSICQGWMSGVDCQLEVQ